jgi:hypothetical protein
MLKHGLAAWAKKGKSNVNTAATSGETFIRAKIRKVSGFVEMERLKLLNCRSSKANRQILEKPIYSLRSPGEAGK